MAIKNWTVTVESVKSTAARELYLNNTNHPNHSDTERIVSIWGNPQTTLNIQHQCEKRRLEQAMRRKGGRPPTPAMEYVFTLPKGIRPSEQQWQSMLKRIIKNIARSIGVKPSDFNGIVRAVLHQQNQIVTQRQGSGDHLHVVIGKFTNTGHHLKELQKIGAIHTAKLSFNDAVRAELGICHHNYITQKNYPKSAKKRAPRWKVQAVREKEAQEELIASVQHNLSKVLKQCEKWLKAFDSGDLRQMERQYNRITKSLEQLDTSNVKSEKFFRLIDSITTSIDVKSKKANLPKLMRNV